MMSKTYFIKIPKQHIVEIAQAKLRQLAEINQILDSRTKSEFVQLKLIEAKKRLISELEI